MGYTTAADLREGYPKFFWEMVSPFITEGIRLLRRTQEGQKWVANLYANVFTAGHEAPAYGPERREKGDRRTESDSVFKIKDLPKKELRSNGRRSNDIDPTGKRSA